MKKLKIYVAGAYSDDNVIGVLKNIGRGEDWAAELFRRGFAPFTPWHDKSFVIGRYTEEFDVNDFYEYSIEWLLVSDALFIVPNEPGLKDWNESIGTLKEIEIAKNSNIPVFYELNDLLNWRKMVLNELFA